MKRLAARMIMVCGFLALIGGCAVPQQEAKTFDMYSTVNAGGMQFKVNNVAVVRGHRLSPSRSTGTYLYAFDVAVKNLQTQPVPFQFQPKFRLVGEHGFYEPHQTATYQLGFELGVNVLDPINPMVTVQRPLGFVVPPGKYRLEVAVPSSVRFGLLRSETTANRFLCHFQKTTAPVDWA